MKGDIKCSQVPAREETAAAVSPGHPQVPPAPLPGTLTQHVQNQLESDPVLGLPTLLSAPKALVVWLMLLSSPYLPLSLCHSICVLYRPSLWTTSYFVFYICLFGFGLSLTVERELCEARGPCHRSIPRAGKCLEYCGGLEVYDAVSE